MKKVFGVGLSSTGKHSLMAALEILGYTTIHYPVSYDEIDKHDASCDVFVWLNYKVLDKKYPGSKFIYTTRDQRAWVDSLMRHLNKYRPENKSRFKRNMRVEAWGNENPSANQLIEARQKHRDDITRYFSKRPGNLLILDLTKNNDWKELCLFLDQPIPEQEFPHIDTSA